MKFKDVHLTCMRVLAEGLAELGLLPVSVDEAMDEKSTVYRRWTLHGFGHMLGIDVHDCATPARRSTATASWARATCSPSSRASTSSPRTSWSPRSCAASASASRTTSLVTADGAVNLSAGLPRTSDEVETWLAEQREAGPRLPG